MLSAVAARKAAKAAAAHSESSTSHSKPPSPSQSPSPPPTKPPSKRKSRVSALAEPSKNNKKVKVVHRKTAKHVRYFEPNDAQLESAASHWMEASSSESDSSSDEEMEVPPPVKPSSTTVTNSKRAWSPSRPMADPSDDEEHGQSAAFDPAGYPDPTPGKPEPLPLSSFRPVLNHNVYSIPESEHVTGGKAIVLILQPNETVALLGTYSLCVLHGNLSLLGVTLSPSNTKHTVFAPRSSPIPILSWAESTRQGSCTFPIPPAVRQQVNTTAILVEYLCTGVEGLGRICKVFESSFKPSRESEALPGFDLPKLHVVNNVTRDIHPFVLPSSWEAALKSIDEHRGSEMGTAPVCLVKGAKKSGKSSLARTLVNRLLTRYRRVAFLECDLGQSEFTPAGLVALNVVENYVFGPPFTHPSLPYRAHYIGSASPRASPSHYLHSIQALLESYKLNLQFPMSVDEPSLGDERIYDAIPLVVNTMGWTKGLGADLNARIEEFIEASHVFDTNGTEEKEWPASSHPRHTPGFSAVSRPSVKQLFEVEAIQVETTNMYQTATDHRHLNILSYFHAVFPDIATHSSSESTLRQITATSWNTSLPLCAQYPYEVDYTQAFDHVYLTGAGYEDVVPSELTRVLNGAIVGLVSGGPANSLSRSVQPASQEISPLSYTPADPPPDPAHSMCHGLALIRGLPPSSSPRSPLMHILTPVPTILLSQTRLFVKGEIELPIWGMLDFREDEEGWVAGVEKGQVPYLQWGKGEGIGSEKRRVRRNLMRKGQM